MLKFSELLTEMEKMPMYMAVNPDEHTIKVITQFQKDNNIPNPHSASKLHLTLIYSKKPVPEPSPQAHRLYKGTFDKWEVFSSMTSGKATRCLVAKIASIDLVARHKELMKQLDASYDYDEYVPHITMSYDIGDIDIKTLPPLSKSPIYFSAEYAQPLVDF